MSKRGDEMTERAKHEKLPNGKAARRKAMASAVSNPATPHGALGHGLLSAIAGGELDQGDVMVELHERLKEVRGGKLGSVHDMLTAQAFSLDAIYVDMMRRAMLNFGQYPDAVERYMRLALKAQSQSRATLEALAKLHQPREQTVRHIHVDNRGGQAVIADTVNTGGQQNGNDAGQAHATAALGFSPPLLGSYPLGGRMSVTSGEGPEAVPNARRDKSGRT